MSHVTYPTAQFMLGSHVCQIANDEKGFEILIAYADGREKEIFTNRTALLELQKQIADCLEYEK